MTIALTVYVVLNRMYRDFSPQQAVARNRVAIHVIATMTPARAATLGATAYLQTCAPVPKCFFRTYMLATPAKTMELTPTSAILPLLNKRVLVGGPLTIARSQMTSWEADLNTGNT